MNDSVPKEDESKKAFESMATVDQMELAAACWRANGENGACSPSAQSLIDQADSCDRWAADFAAVLKLLAIAICPNARASGHEQAWPCQWCDERTKAIERHQSTADYESLPDEPTEPDGECFRGGEAAAYLAEQQEAARRLK